MGVVGQEQTLTGIQVRVFNTGAGWAWSRYQCGRDWERSSQDNNHKLDALWNYAQHQASYAL